MNPGPQYLFDTDNPETNVIVADLLLKFTKHGTSPLSPKSSTQRKLVKMLASGNRSTYVEMAADLGISTARLHQLLRKVERRAARFVLD